MSQYTEEKARRKEVLRLFRRQERAFDTALERVEREIKRLLKRKTIVTREQLDKFATLYQAVQREFEVMTHAAADVFASIDY
jgi:hypothetical protein